MRLSFGPVRPCIRAVGKGCRYMFVLLLSAILSQIVPGQALASDTEVQTVWRLLDYVAVDYAGAVSGGRVSSEAEYAEMVEFAEDVLMCNFEGGKCASAANIPSEICGYLKV